jgi:thymidylate kinase
VRTLLKHTSMIELAYVIRDWSNIRAEAAWLVGADGAEAAAREIGHWVPGFEPDLLLAGANAINDDAPLLTRIRLGRSVRARLRSFERRSRARARAVAIASFAQRARYQARGLSKGLTPGGGGAVIAFVGSEATGKSTMLSLTESWLRDQFTVRRVHAGKPPSTALTFVPNLMLPLLRALAPRQRTTHMTVSVPSDIEIVDPSEGASKPVPLLFAVRSLLLAHDRRALLRRAFADSANGMIVLSDRYPSSVVGTPDSPQLARFAAATSTSRLRRWMIDRESAIYADIPPADVVIQLCAPLDVTLERNRTRGKTEPEEFVRVRHALSSSMEFDHSRVHRFDTNQSEAETFALIRRTIWEAL